MRICFFGDSFVNGTGDDECLGWVGRVSALARQTGTDITCYNLGVRRDTSADIARRWRNEAEVRLPDKHDGRLVFSFGANDCTNSDNPDLPHIPLTTTLINARLIFSTAIAWKPTLVIGPLPTSANPSAHDRVTKLSAELENLCAELGLPFFNFLAVADSIKALWKIEAEAGDRIHPNRGAYAQLAGAVSDWPAWKAWTQVE